jgi:hypothetical protein
MRLKMDHPKFLTTDKAAEYIEATWGIPCSPKTMAKLGLVDKGILKSAEG